MKPMSHNWRVMRKHNHDGKTTELWEFSAENDAAAAQTFTQCIAGMLEEDTTDHYLIHSYIEYRGGWVDESCAMPVQDEDILPDLPPWYRGPGIYDEIENPILLWGESLTQFDLGDYHYWVVRKLETGQ